MPLYDYQIATGHNNTAGYANIENVVTYAPRAQRVGLPPVRRVTLDQRVHYNGVITITWSWEGMSQDDLDALVDDYVGDYDTPDAAVTIRTRKQDGTYDDYNAYLALPIEGEDYERVTSTKVRNLRITFRNLVAIS